MEIGKHFNRGLRKRLGHKVRTVPLAAALVLGNLFLHKPISDVCDSLYASIGRGPYEWLTLLGLSAMSVAGAIILLRRRAGDLRQPRVVACIAALAAMTIAAQRMLLVSNVELIHLPQFGLLATLLLASGLGPLAAWIGALLGGVLDEVYQGLVIYAHLPVTRFDLNDVVLNAIGAAWAVILIAAGSRRADAIGRDRRIAGLVAVAAALAVACWLAPPRVDASADFPYWRPALRRAATGRYYHVMSAAEALAALLLLMWLVQVAVRDRRRRLATAATPAVAAALFVVAINGCGPHAAGIASRDAGAAGSGATAVGGQCDVARRGNDRFIVTFWCGPPLAQFTDARAAQIAAAGFNVVGPPCEGAMTPALNRKALDVAHRYGLLLWINDGRLSPHDGLHPEWESRLIEVVGEYGDHPALDGYFLIDEPHAEQFADIGKVVARLQAVDGRRLPYVNVLPDYISAEGLGTETYREHVDQFMGIVRPPLLSFDYYPFKRDTDRISFFDNLGLIRDVALQQHVPFLLIVQAMPHGPYRDPTEAEIAWQVNHALAFGARGISYFAYWTPVHVASAARMQFRRGLIEGGQPTEHYHQAARINAAARAIAAQLDGLRSIAVADSHGRFGVPFPLGPLAGIDGGPVTAGLFGCGGTAAVLLVNQDYQRERRVVPRLAEHTAAPEVFDAGARRWQRLADPAIVLEPGGARLLRWGRSA
jgi:hypothetical protein